MKALIQRVSHASVAINGTVHSIIENGMLVLLGIDTLDTEADADWLCAKISSLRIFADENGLMNKALGAVDGGLLLVSQFTLIASYKKGNRPSFLNAAKPEQAIQLYEYCKQTLSCLLGKPVATGVFGADMQVSSCNNGPVTIMIDTKNKE